MPLWTDFPDTLDTSIVQKAIGWWRGTPFDRDADGLTLFNVGGYAYQRFIIGTASVSRTMSVQFTPLTLAEVYALEKAFCAPGASIAALDWAKWLGLLKLILELLGRV